MPPAALPTMRLKLRPVGPQDQTTVLAGLSDIALSGWLAVVPHPYTAADFDFFQREIAKPGQTFAVEDAGGFVGIMGLERGKLGYWFSRHAHGQGYATEAASGVLASHFAEGLGRVASGYFDENAPSANVLRKLGFVETGRGQLMCRALDRMRPHVDMILDAMAFANAKSAR